MEKNQPFFDPYNFNMQNFSPSLDNPIQNDLNINPNTYYEGQYLYYRYLTQMMEYRIKCKEFEGINRENKKS